MDTAVIVAVVGTVGVVVVALINRGNVSRDVIVVRDELEAMEILLQNEKRENDFLRGILAAKELHVNELISQLKRHAPGIQPAAYAAPEDGEEP